MVEGVYSDYFAPANSNYGVSVCRNGVNSPPPNVQCFQETSIGPVSFEIFSMPVIVVNPSASFMTDPLVTIVSEPEPKLVGVVTFICSAYNTGG